MTELVVAAPPVGALPETPYVGLVPYTEADSAFFFGREAEKTIVTANVRANGLTLVYGPSGVGKTSLLQAGVVHDLRQRIARTAADAPDRPPFAIAVFRSWRDEPLPVLMEEIRLSVVEALGGADVAPWRRGTSVVDTLRGWTERVRTLLVLLDQFEDYFLYHPSESGEETFDAEFPRIVNDPNLRVHFLVSIREDAWAKLDRFEGRIPQLFVNYVRIEHLDRDGAREAVERPVAEYNSRLASDADRYTVEPELVEAVVQAASTTGPGLAEGADGTPVSGEDEVETPFLQLVMERLWRATVDAGRHALTMSTLLELGGAQRIVERHLVDALGALDAREQEIAADAFRYLVTGSRRRVVQAASDLAEWLAIPEAELVPVLEKLASGESGRILRPVPPPPGREREGQRYEIFHDVLGEPILEWRRAYERAREQEAEAWRQRAVRRRLALIAAGLLVLTLAFAGFAAWALHERGVAADRADVAESQELAARSIRVQSLDPRQSLDLATAAEAKRSTPQADEALRRALVAWPKPTVLVPSGRTVYGVDFSPDGRLIATAGEGGARVTSITGRPEATLVPRKTVTSARFSADGHFVVAASADGRVRVWRVDGWRELPSRARVLPHLLARAAFSADGDYVVAGGYPGWPGNRVWRFSGGRIGRELTKRDDRGGWIEPDGTARVVDARTAASAARLARPAPYTFASTPRGKISVGAGRSELTPVFNTLKRTVRAELPESHGAVVSPDGYRIALDGDSGTVIWDIDGYAPQALVAGSNVGTAFSPDGRLLVSTDEIDETARVWDTGSGERLAELPPKPPRYPGEVTLSDPYPKPIPPKSATGAGASANAPTRRPAFELVRTARFSKESDVVVTWGRRRGGAQLREPFGTRKLELLRARSESRAGLLLPVAVSPDGRLVATAEPTGVIDVRSTRDGHLLSRLRGSTDYVSRIVFDADGDLVAASSFDRFVRIWRTADGRPTATLGGHEARVGDVAFSPDGHLVASASEDGTARIWSVPDGKLVHVLREPRGAIAAVSFSSDGDALVTGGARGTTRVWSTGSWKQRAELRPSRSDALVLRASFSPDGDLVATLGLDGTARLWHSDGGPPIRTLTNVSSIAFSPGGAEVVVARGEATVRILRLSDRKEIGLLRGHTDVVNDARFSGDGSMILTAGGDGTARVWQAATNGQVAVVTPSDSPVVETLLARDGRLVVVDNDGVHLYACEPCLEPAQLRALAEQRPR